MLRACVGRAQTLFDACRGLYPSASRVTALIHVAAAVGGRPSGHRRSLAIGSSPGQSDLAATVEGAIAGAIPARARVDLLDALPSSGEMIGAYLRDRLFTLPIGHHRLRVLADLAPCVRGDGEEVTALRRVGVALATGRRSQAIAAIEARGRARFTPPVLRLIETGVIDLPGRRGRAVFVGCVDDPEEARAYAPSMPLYRELLWRGEAWRAAARRVLGQLTGEDAHDARMLAAIADAAGAVRGLGGGAGGAQSVNRGDPIARVRHLHGPARRQRALAAMAGTAIAAGDVEGAEAIAAGLPLGEIRERVLLAIAWSDLDRAARVRAVERLDPRGDPCLHALSALTRARLEPGESPRAPGLGSPLMAWRWIPAHAVRHLPELPGEAITGASFLSDLLFEAALHPRSKGLVDALVTPPGGWHTLIEDASVALRLVRRGSAGEVAAGAPQRLSSRVGAAIRSAEVMAGALDLLAARVAAARLVEDAGVRLTADGAFLLGALGPAASWDACRRDPRFQDALSPLRASYDEGVSLSPYATARRTALLDACRASLRAIEGGAPCEDPAGIVAARLSCLVNLGGEVAATIVRRAIEASPSAGGPHGRALFGALAALAPRRAIRLFVLRGGAIGSALDPAEAMALLSAGDLDRSYLERWRAALERLRAPLGPEGASAWLEAFARAFVERCSALPTAASLDAVGAPGEAIAPSGEAFVDLLRERLDRAVGAGDTDAFLRTLEDEPGVLRAVVALTSGTTTTAPWSTAEWAQVVARLRHRMGSIDPAPLALFGRLLPDGDAAVAALLRGAAPTAALARPIALDGVHWLRWLDKRRDFAAALRFADALPTCFNSSSPLYRSMDTQRDVLTVHRDPLSFCFEVTQREDRGPATPFGFAFGFFGLTGRGPVALLSGLYLRRQSAELRARGLAAIEEGLCRPLGLRSLAVSARYAGAGALPPGYTHASRPVRRLRALTGPMPRPHDDLGLVPSAELVTHAGLFWSDLDA
jgi:hypothetical protein